ncbi:hypothetical protein SBOR_3610 [Sclerotinia borealis F-4128]|uniref:Uncharacterized protein n=1 Tax=Sclerotinia borealis (strain F-4128) TaxID=1432307 RepID=W9CNA6_SCLBF|nr:hypothetical protein SBOR_3610 [Sclerotinia borealis F-4128]
MRFPRIKSPVSVTESLIDLDMVCENVTKLEETGIQSSELDNSWDNSIVPDNDLVDSNSVDFLDPTPNPLTAKNLEALSNSTNFSPSKRRNKSSSASTDRSGSVEEVVNQVEDQDRQEIPPIDNSATETTIANILSLYGSPSILQLINSRNLDLVGDLVGRIVHFDLREPISQDSQRFGSPPVAGKNGLLSWLTSQEKMADLIIQSGSREFFPWGWNTAIFSRAVRLGVRTACKVPYHMSTQTGHWYKPVNREERDRVAWKVLGDTILGLQESGIKPISDEFRLLVDDFYSGKEVKSPEYYAYPSDPKTLTAEKDSSTVGKDSVSKPFRITKIDMDKYGQNLYRNLYGETEDNLKQETQKQGLGDVKHIVNLYLLEVIKMNEIEDALKLVEKEMDLPKSSLTIAKVQGTEVRRSPEHPTYINKLNTLEKNKEEAGKAAARTALEDFVQNINIHGLDSIMGSETWSITHVRTIPTLDESAEEATIVETVTADSENRSTSPLLIPDNSESKNETAPKKKKKKKTKGKPNAKKVAKQEEEDPESTGAEAASQTTEIADKLYPSIASDPLNYEFDDSMNLAIEDESKWNVVKTKPSRPKGPRTTYQSDSVHSSKSYKHNASVNVKVPPNQKVGQKKGEISTKVSDHIAATTTKPGDKFEIESFNDFPEIISPWKKVTKRDDAAKAEPTVMVGQPALPKMDLDIFGGIAAIVENGLTSTEAQIAADKMPALPSKEQSDLPVEVAAEDSSNVNKYDDFAHVDATRTLAYEIAKEVVHVSIEEVEFTSTISPEYEAGNTATIPLEEVSHVRGLTLEHDAPIYLGRILDFPHRARRRFRSSSTTAAFFASSSSTEVNDDEEYSDSTLIIERPNSVAKISSMDPIVDNAIAVGDSSTTAGTPMDTIIGNVIPADSFSAIDNLSTDIIGITSTVADSPVSDCASLDTVVYNEPIVADSCSIEVHIGDEESPSPEEGTSISDSGSVSAASSAMTIHGPQPQGFHPSFLESNSQNLDLMAPTSMGYRTHIQHASVASYEIGEQNMTQFSNGWSQQQVSNSTILHESPHTHADPNSVQIPFDCTYCAKHYYATTESPMVLCHGCGLNSGVKYCSIACLLAGSLTHADVCLQESVEEFEIPTVDHSPAYQIYYTGPLAISSSDELPIKKSKYNYRQKVFGMYCHSGPFPQLLVAWARKNDLLHTLQGQDATEATKRTGSYFVFKSSLTSNERRTNPDSTVICTIKLRPSDHMVQVISRCMKACFSSHCEHDIQEFLFRLIKDFLSDDEAFDCFPHTEDRTTVFYEFQHQFHLEFGFHADMQRNQSDKFDFELEWPLVDHLLNQFEIGTSD